MFGCLIRVSLGEMTKIHCNDTYKGTPFEDVGDGIRWSQTQNNVKVFRSLPSSR